MLEAVCPFPTSSWCDVELSTGYIFMAWYSVEHRDFTLSLVIILQMAFHHNPFIRIQICI
jgi:hypothetical protein